MITKILKISDLLILKLCASKYVFENINNYFPNTSETQEKFEYEITYNELEKIPKMYEKLGGNIISPFRNSKYFVSEIDGLIIAYAKKQEFSDENVIIRNKNDINIFAINDKNNKVLIRLIIELIVRKLLEKNYYPLHASSIVKEGKAIIYFGQKGSGKSTALFNAILLDNSYPLANDITFIGKENGIWKAIGTSYDLTFDKSLISQINDKEFCYSAHNLESQYHSDKLRYSANEFCSIFETSWIWSAPIASINVVNLNPNVPFKESLSLTNSKILAYLIKYGKDNNFTFDDLLMINNLQPNFEYTDLAKGIQFNEIEGNILNYYSKIKSLGRK